MAQLVQQRRLLHVLGAVDVAHRRHEDRAQGTHPEGAWVPAKALVVRWGGLRSEHVRNLDEILRKLGQTVSRVIGSQSVFRPVCVLI